MPTLPELLRFEIEPGESIELVLRSGQILTGEVEEVDLIADIVRLGGWAVRIPEIAGIRVDEEVAQPITPTSEPVVARRNNA